MPREGAAAVPPARPGGGERPALLGAGGGLLYLYKPAGLPVFPPGPSLLDFLLEHLPEQGAVAWPPGFEGGIAHRLDTGTSGLVLAARDPRALERLRADFAAGRLRKLYRFLSPRQVPWDRHRVERALAHARRRRGRMVVQRGRDTPHRGRWFPAVTELHRLGPHDWEAAIRTGVTHQVRAHAAFVGLPVLGDRRYGGGRLPGAGPERFCLHALRVEGPGWRSPDAPLPAWWEELRRGLGRGQG